MQTKLILITILLSLINCKVLREEIIDNQLFLSLEQEYEEETIDFTNIEDEHHDQIICNIRKCSCYFSIESQGSGQITDIQCQENKIAIFRTNTKMRTIQKQNTSRITTETYSDSDMPNSKTISSALTLKWKFNSDGTIEFATIWNKLSWLGIGFGSSMRNVDMITINVSGSTVNLIDLYSTSDTTPSTDSSQDYTLISYSVGSSSVSTRFSRQLSTGDSKDKTLTKGSTYSWCYAYSSATSMEMHTYYAGFSITLSDSSSTTDTSSTSSTSSSSSTDTSSTSSSTDTSSSSTDTSSTSSSSTSTSDSTESSTSSDDDSSSSNSTSTSFSEIAGRLILVISIGFLVI